MSTASTPECEVWISSFRLTVNLGCPRGTREGGGNVPFVLREEEVDSSISLADKLRQGPKYELIGPCCLDGAMYGERMDHHSWKDNLHAEPLDFDTGIDPTGEEYIKGVYRTRFYHIE